MTVRAIVGEPVAVGDAAVIPLIEQRRSVFRAASTLVWHGERRAVGVVVRRGSSVRGFLVDGGECELPALLEAFPGLAELLGA